MLNSYPSDCCKAPITLKFKGSPDYLCSKCHKKQIMLPTSPCCNSGLYSTNRTEDMGKKFCNKCDKVVAPVQIGPEHVGKTVLVSSILGPEREYPVYIHSLSSDGKKFRQSVGFPEFWYSISDYNLIKMLQIINSEHVDKTLLISKKVNPTKEYPVICVGISENGEWFAHQDQFQEYPVTWSKIVEYNLIEVLPKKISPKNMTDDSQPITAARIKDAIDLIQTFDNYYTHQNNQFDLEDKVAGLHNVIKDLINALKATQSFHTRGGYSSSDLFSVFCIAKDAIEKANNHIFKGVSKEDIANVEARALSIHEELHIVYNERDKLKVRVEELTKQLEESEIAHKKVLEVGGEAIRNNIEWYLSGKRDELEAENKKLKEKVEARADERDNALNQRDELKVENTHLKNELVRLSIEKTKSDHNLQIAATTVNKTIEGLKDENNSWYEFSKDLVAVVYTIVNYPGQSHLSEEDQKSLEQFIARFHELDNNAGTRSWLNPPPVSKLYKWLKRRMDQTKNSKTKDLNHRISKGGKIGAYKEVLNYIVDHVAAEELEELNHD